MVANFRETIPLENFWYGLHPRFYCTPDDSLELPRDGMTCNSLNYIISFLYLAPVFLHESR
jgi:hypothetical protein